MSLTGIVIDDHLKRLSDAVADFRAHSDELVAWGTQLAWTLTHGGRLLAAGNGGSAAQAQHLAAELVGKLDGDRAPLSAFALNTDTSALTAIANDYGYDQVFARQIRAHGRPGDIVLLLSTSGASRNVLAAAETAAELDIEVWAMTGAAPNPLGGRCTRTVAIASRDTQVIQELHLGAVHMLCALVDAMLPSLTTAGPSLVEPVVGGVFGDDAQSEGVSSEGVSSEGVLGEGVLSDGPAS